MKVSRYIAASSEFSVFKTLMMGGSGRRKSSVTIAQGAGMDEDKIRELLEKQMQGQQHDIAAMMALMQSLAQVIRLIISFGSFLVYFSCLFCDTRVGVACRR